MIVTALAQLRLAASVAFGLPLSAWSLDSLISGALATRHEFGAIDAEAAEVLSGPPLDEAARQDMHRRRVRAQAQRQRAKRCTTNTCSRRLELMHGGSHTTTFDASR